jgi:hypothetical protein
MSRNRLVSRASEVLLVRMDQTWRLFLEKLIRLDGKRHFPRLRVDEIRQHEDQAINDPDDHRDDRQKPEQAGHLKGLRRRY